MIPFTEKYHILGNKSERESIICRLELEWHCKIRAVRVYVLLILLSFEREQRWVRAGFVLGKHSLQYSWRKSE